MPKDTINDAISIKQHTPGFEEGEVVIDVDNVSIVFNMASEQLNSLKEYFIALAKGELRFKELRALKGVSFAVRKGDVFGILGTNGSGKSTMLKVIAGVLEPSEGTCTVKGQIAPLIELGAGFDMDLTARENVFLNGALLGYPQDFIEEKFDDIVEFAEVQDFLDIPLKNYSSGMVARIAFAIATVIVPEILIVDEVLSVGDFMFQQKCEDRIRSLIEDHHVTVLIVSHNTDQVRRLCNKAIWIEKGNTRICGTAEQVCELYSILGGRVGSAEAEAPIVEAYEYEYEVPRELQSTVFGADRYDTAYKLHGKALLHGADAAAVLADSARMGDCAIATGISGLLGTSPLFFLGSQVPDSTQLAVKKAEPREIFVLGGRDMTAESCLETCKDVDYYPDVVLLEQRDPKGVEVYRYFKERGLAWGSTAVFLRPDAPFADAQMALVSPYVYTAAAPVFIVENAEAAHAALSVLTDASGSCTRIICIGLDDASEKCVRTEAEAHNVQIVCFDGTDGNAGNATDGSESEEDAGADAKAEAKSAAKADPNGDAAKKKIQAAVARTCALNEEINVWIAAEWAAEGEDAEARELVVTSPACVVDNEILGAFAGSNRALVLLEDTANLDSTAAAIGYCRAHAAEIDRFAFLGNDSRFDKGSRHLLAKARAMGLADAAHNG